MRKDVEQLHSKFNMWRKEAEGQLSPTHTEQLTSLCDEVTKLLEQEYSFQAVHLADEIYGFAGDRGLELRVQLHQHYSKCDVSNEEIFWSRWQLVDTLALLKHCKDAVEEQSGLYNWSRDHLMSDYVLQALYDSTQAQCWIATGRFDDWVALYFDALPLLKDSHTHRRTQCLFLRTGAEMFVQQNRLDDAYEQVVQLENINNEEPEWTDQLIFWCGITTTKLEIFRRQGQWTEYKKTAQPALVFLEQQFQALLEAPRDRNVICHIAHDVGACLFWAKRYAQARPLLEFAAQHQGIGSTHLFLAACCWADDKDRAAALKHLRLAQQTIKGNWLLRGRYRTFFLEMEEFADVYEDPEFMDAVSGPARG